MNYIVLDLEFNQYYNFENTSSENKTINKKKECPFEIIQIGAVKLNSNFKVVGTFNEFIKPTIYKKLHPIVERLTNFSDNTFENKDNFTKIYNKFIKFINGDKNILCIWGVYDIKTLYKNANFYNLNTSKIPNKFIDVQIMASSYLKYVKGSSIGLKKAIEMVGINTSLSFHNALNDAIYTAKIFSTLKNEPINIKEVSFKNLSKNNLANL